MVGDALLFAFDGSGSRGGRKKKKRTENRERGVRKYQSAILASFIFHLHAYILQLCRRERLTITLFVK